MAQTNRRVGQEPVPEDLKRYLSAEQTEALAKAEKYGWKVKFVRRPTIVLVYEDGHTLGVLEEDGYLNKDAAVRERSESAVAPDIPRGASANRLLV